MSHVNDASTLPTTWWKSSYSNTGAQCVECGIVSPATVAIRDSKQPHGPALLFSTAALSTFVRQLGGNR
ncbi:DUF397 domain-containing protein [Streptomyces albidoflavus]|uniref:DUF397 domain-containing protein n=1 Tax=Streptomyces TaxID=1883 RepID=UPI000361BEB4|nr:MULTISPECIES: DUF397 domain-containing protein [Streptomyces]ALM39088.1 DUF397 domain containing protein [Streptomyces sp. FR-008]KAF0793134.1 hypothetical protein P405_31010 [Streptomyces sp. FR-008]MBV7250711.1 DUF397 domain-containing protein [Streptomyces sp. S-2]NEC94468.1 DUF397 domain-containing protein [Streptomyces albidoflavus]RZD69301.1 DUF397 domain-containing protein [Streptomyces albidoflavus]